MFRFEGSEQGMVALLVVVGVLIVAWAVWQGTRDGKRGRAKAEAKSALEARVDDHEFQLTGIKKLIENELRAFRGVVDANGANITEHREVTAANFDSARAELNGFREVLASAGLKLADSEALSGRLDRVATQIEEDAATAKRRLDGVDAAVATLAAKNFDLGMKMHRLWEAAGKPRIGETITEQSSASSSLGVEASEGGASSSPLPTDAEHSPDPARAPDYSGEAVD